MHVELVRVRRTARSEVRAATALLAAQLEDHGLRESAAQVERGVAAALARGTPSVILLARRGRSWVGACLFHLLPSVEWGGRGVWVEELYVAPRARRAGVATLLLREVARLGAAAGAHAADLEVARSHRGALRLYRRLGFRRLDRVRLAQDLAALAPGAAAP